MNPPGVIENFPYLGLFILLMLGGLGLPFPEELSLMLCGLFISTGTVKPLYAIPVVYAGLLAGDMAIYFAGWKWGRAVVTHKMFHMVLPPERFVKLEERFKRQGVLFILLGRYFIGLRTQIFLTSGIMRTGALKFLLADAIAAVFTVAVMVGAGYMGGTSAGILWKDITRIRHLMILIVVVLIPVYLFYRYLKGGEEL